MAREVESGQRNPREPGRRQDALRGPRGVAARRRPRGAGLPCKEERKGRVVSDFPLLGTLRETLRKRIYSARARVRGPRARTSYDSRAPHLIKLLEEVVASSCIP